MCKDHKNCEFAFVRNAVSAKGLVPLGHICDKIVLIGCALCYHSNVEFHTEEDYMTHLCLDHFYKSLSCFVKKLEPYLCPIQSCGKRCNSFEDLILHYGAIPHAKVVSLVFDAAGDNIKQFREENEAKVSSLQNELISFKEKNDSGKNSDTLLKLRNQEFGSGPVFQDQFGENKLELQNANVTIQQLTFRNNELQSALAENNSNLNHLRTMSEATANEAANERISIKNTVNDSKVKYQHLLQEINIKDREIKGLKQDIGKHTDDIDETGNRLKKMSAECKELKDICKNKDNEKHELKIKVEKMESSYKNLKKESDEIEKERDDIDSELCDLRKKCSSLQSYLNQGEQIIEEEKDPKKVLEEVMQSFMIKDSKESNYVEKIVELKDDRINLEAKIKRVELENIQFLDQAFKVQKEYQENKKSLEDEIKNITAKKDTEIKIMKDDQLVVMNDKDSIIQMQKESHEQLENELRRLKAEKTLELKERERILQIKGEIQEKYENEVAQLKCEKRKLEEELEQKNITNKTEIDLKENILEKQRAVLTTLQDEINSGRKDCEKTSVELVQLKEEMTFNQNNLEQSVVEIKNRDSKIQKHLQTIKSMQESSTCQCFELTRKNEDLKKKLNDAREYCKLKDAETKLLKSQLPDGDSDSNSETDGKENPTELT
eukprot:GFUD01020473.1.p1 GENE.GFUD01020473.1~~GFUD01020473.1.p1  ORF type:complete len:663 (+),score=172.02 GFUD01020473.1:1-1989(+)